MLIVIKKTICVITFLFIKTVHGQNRAKVLVTRITAGDLTNLAAAAILPDYRHYHCGKTKDDAMEIAGLVSGVVRSSQGIRVHNNADDK
jgi:hypothetical protein